jgi:two-component system, LytTR family, sensor kinase
MPRWKLALIVVGVAVLFAFLDTVQTYLRRYVSWGEDSFDMMFFLMLQPWLVFAALVPAVVALARKRRPVAVHVVAALLFPVAHSVLLTFVHQLRVGFGGFWLAVARLLCEYFVTEVMIYGAIAGVVWVVAAARLRTGAAEARLHALRGQLHPHFLFNALNTVSMLVREGRSAVALDVMAELGELLRALLRDAAGHEVSLAAELEFNRRYLELERARFGDRLTVSFDCDGALLGALVPHLVLQPLVENAVRHGVSRVAGPGAIRVSAERRGDLLALEVWNDGPAPAADAGAGLRITRDRLEGLYGRRQALSLAPAAGGVRARVTLPYHTAPLPVAA